MKKILLSASFLLAFFLMLCCYQLQAFAVQTNVNEVTDLFDRHIENKDALMRNMQQQNDNAMDQIKSKEHLNSIDGLEAAEGKASQLNSIRETDLENAGREKRNSTEYQFYDENELEPDYSKAGNRMHKIDADEIVEATEKTMRNLGADLMKRLVALGFNCKTVKGSVQKEPTHYIEIKRELARNTEYDQFFCEEPRNQYNCNDGLTLTCKSQGIQWGAWQDKQIRIPGGELVSFGRTIFQVEKTGKRCFEYKLSVQGQRSWFGTTPADPYVVGSMREFLTTKHPGSTIDNISTEMSSWWEGGIFSIDGWTYGGRTLGSKDYAWNTYVVNYKYRNGSPACFEWTEDWTERCVLK